MDGSNLESGQLFTEQWRIILSLEEAPVPCFRVRDDKGRDAELLLLPFDRELEKRAEKLTSLRHENLIAIYEVGRRHENTYLVREMVMGQSVAEWIRREQRLGYDQALGIACQLCLASTAAAEAGFDFLGINPKAVKVDPSGFAKVDPLSLAGTPEDDTTYRSTEERKGQAPNQLSDIFRIGLLIFEMLLGRPLGRTKDGGIIIKPISDKLENLTPVHDQVLAKALAEKPSERYENADKLLNDLHPLLMHRPAPTPADPTSWYEDKRFWLYIAIVLGAAAVILSIILNLLPLPSAGQD